MRRTGMNTSRQVTGALASAALVCAALAGCGSTVSGAGGGGLCGQQSQVTRLVVVKRGPLTAPGHSVPHATVTVGDPTEARSVAEAACALPAMPSGAAACPMDTGLIYRLMFSAGGTKLAAVTADRTGCQGVRGLGQVRWTARSPRSGGYSARPSGEFPQPGPLPAATRQTAAPSAAPSPRWAAWYLGVVTRCKRPLSPAAPSIKTQEKHGSEH